MGTAGQGVAKQAGSGKAMRVTIRHGIAGAVGHVAERRGEKR